VTKLADRNWEVGIWEPWSEWVGPHIQETSAHSILDVPLDKREKKDYGEAEHEVCRSIQSTRMILPTRYLIAESV
jgi:hypothetical protein